MAGVRKGLVGAMSWDARMEGATSATDGTFRGTLHKVYGSVRPEFGHISLAYVGELAEAEDRLLDALNEVPHEADALRPVQDPVPSDLPKSKEQHAPMRDYKWVMQRRH